MLGSKIVTLGPRPPGLNDGTAAVADAPLRARLAVNKLTVRRPAALPKPGRRIVMELSFLDFCVWESALQGCFGISTARIREKIENALRRDHTSRHRQKGCPAGSRRTRTFSCGWWEASVAPNASASSTAESRSPTWK